MLAIVIALIIIGIGIPWFIKYQPKEKPNPLPKDFQSYNGRFYGILSWVSIKDSLPEEGLRVLVYTYHPWYVREVKIFIAEYDGNKWHDEFNSTGYIITHWHELPRTILK